MLNEPILLKSLLVSVDPQKWTFCIRRESYFKKEYCDAGFCALGFVIAYCISFSVDEEHNSLLQMALASMWTCRSMFCAGSGIFSRSSPVLWSIQWYKTSINHTYGHFTVPSPTTSSKPASKLWNHGPVSCEPTRRSCWAFHLSATKWCCECSLSCCIELKYANATGVTSNMISIWVWCVDHLRRVTIKTF